MPTAEVHKIAEWDSLHFFYKVKLATLACKIFYNCTPLSMGYILTKKTTPMHHVRAMNTVIVPRFNIFHEQFNSIESIYCVEPPYSRSCKKTSHAEL